MEELIRKSDVLSIIEDAERYPFSKEDPFKSLIANIKDIPTIGLCACNKDVTPDKMSSPLGETVKMMLSDDYKERFIAEYRQTKIRYERLKAFNNKIEAARTVNSIKVEEPKHDCPFDLLREQQRRMGEYLHILELRAVIEEIKL